MFMSVQQCDRSHLGKLVCDFCGTWFTSPPEKLFPILLKEVNVSISSYYVQVIVPENKV